MGLGFELPSKKLNIEEFCWQSGFNDKPGAYILCIRSRIPAMPRSLGQRFEHCRIAEAGIHFPQMAGS